MDSIRRVTMVFLFVMLAASPVAHAQADVWRDFVKKVAVGSEFTVRLENGQRFRATLIGAGDDAVLLQPKTRVAVGVQAVPYTAIVSMERPGKGGMSVAKAAGVGIGAGAGTFVAILLMLAATLD